ncbi:MAG: HAD family hydrolase [Candidatus Omnitrophota bacterium]|nr:MAG: HAD family hydrolase [Candidatus Omnitrophota bacterium]
MIKVVLLDFDGVLVDSLDIKTHAFVHLFRNYPEGTRQQIRDLHLNNLGVSRYEKFRIILKEFLNQPVSEEKLEKLASEFSRFCIEKVIAAPYIKGAYEFISQHYRNYSLYVVSSTPETELQLILEKRGIRKYFKGAYGTPKKKSEICRLIIEKDGLPPSSVVLVGDAVSDLEAAQQCGLHFIARLDETATNPLAKRELKFRLPDLSTLNEVCSRI